MSRAIRRLTCLYVATRALAVGAPERALESLRDPAVGAGRRARRLREHALVELGRLATRKASRGRERSAGRLLGLLAAEDLERARACRDEIGWVLEARSGAALARGRTLAALRAGARAVDGARADGRAWRARGTMADTLRLTVDDGGDWLLVVRNPVRVGHVRAGRSELPFLADVGPVHARLERHETLREGHAWTVEALEGERVTVGGAPARGRVRLSDGDVLACGGVELRFLLPDVGSGAAVVRLARGLECLGASGVVLAGPGEECAVRVGPARRSHVPVAAMAEELLLVWSADRVEVRRLDAESGAPAGEPVALALPPAERVPLQVARRGEGAPVGLTLGPVEGWGPEERAQDAAQPGGGGGWA